MVCSMLETGLDFLASAAHRAVLKLVFKCL